MICRLTCTLRLHSCVLGFVIVRAYVKWTKLTLQPGCSESAQTQKYENLSYTCMDIDWHIIEWNNEQQNITKIFL